MKTPSVTLDELLEHNCIGCDSFDPDTGKCKEEPTKISKMVRKHYMANKDRFYSFFADEDRKPKSPKKHKELKNE